MSETSQIPPGNLLAHFARFGGIGPGPPDCLRAGLEPPPSLLRPGFLRNNRATKSVRHRVDGEQFDDSRDLVFSLARQEGSDLVCYWSMGRGPAEWWGAPCLIFSGWRTRWAKRWRFRIVLA
jgi:hypothetical protein